MDRAARGAPPGTDVTRDGGCLCGAVRYRIVGEPGASGLCHCRTCRRTASAPALPYVEVPSDRFAFVDGRPTDYRSSPAVTRSFCGRCGSPLTYRSADAPGRVDVMICSLDDPGSVTPAFHVWTREKVGWDRVDDGRPAYPTSRAEGP